MKIAVIGTGNIGASYARALAQAKLDVVIGAREPEKAAALAHEISPKLQGGGIDAAFKLADVVLLALPYQAVLDVLKGRSDLAGKVLIDVSNPITPDFQSLTVGLNTSAAEQIQSSAEGAHVVKAFNTIFAGLAMPENRVGMSLQTFVACDDATAKTTVQSIAEKLGMTALDAGGLRNSRFLEPLGMMNIQFGAFLGRGTSIAPMWTTGIN